MNDVHMLICKVGLFRATHGRLSGRSMRLKVQLAVQEMKSTSG